MAKERTDLRDEASPAEMEYNCCMGRCYGDVRNDRILNRTLAILSSFLLCSINGLLLTLGNLSVYTTSYTNVRVNSGTASKSMWTYSMYVTCFGFGVLLTTALDKKISRKLTCILASCLFVCGLTSSYFTLQKSVYALPITLGALCGFASGCIAITSLQLIYPWLDESRGFIISIVKTSAAINGFAMNYFVTFVINPEDERPDTHTSGLSYFSQKKILDRVPFVFVYMGVINAFILLIGCLLIREKKSESFENIIVINGVDKKDTDMSRSACSKSGEGSHLLDNNYTMYMSSYFVTETIPVETRDDINDEGNTKIKVRRRHSTSVLSGLTDIKNAYDYFKRPRTQSITNFPSVPKANDSCFERSPFSNSAEKYQHSCSNEQSDPVKQLTYKDLLKSKTHWLICLSIITFSWHFNITLKYYKLFAQIWIHDDHFLTNLGTVMSISLVFTRPIWGYVIDRFGMKHTLAFALSLTSSALSWLYLTPAVNPWLYCVVVYILWNTVNAHPVFCPAAPLQVYGERNFAKAYAIQSTVLAVGNLCMPFLVQLALEYFLWDTIFAILATIGVVGLIIVLKYFPSNNFHL